MRRAGHGFVVIALLLNPLVGATAPALSKSMTSPFTTWLENGKPLAQIVSDEFADAAHQPVDVLNKYLKKMSGAELPIVDEATGGTPTVFLGPSVGLSRLGNAGELDLGKEGFVISGDGSELVIAGHTRLATIYGVCAFLEECLGVRWYFDDPLFEIVPEIATLKVGRIYTVQKPAFRVRNVGRKRWALYNRQNVRLGLPQEEFRI